MIRDDFYGDNFRWFTGVVKQVGDDRSRVRVRIFGIHHMDDNVKIPDDELPWALVLYPTTGGQTSGGTASHGLVEGTWVVGFFVDGEDSQQPIVLGVINGGQNSMNATTPGVQNNTIIGPPGSQSASPTIGPQAPSSSKPSQQQSSDATSDPNIQLSGSSGAAKVYNYFWERLKTEGAFSGDLKCIVSALVGNFQVESASDNINPQAFNGNDKGEMSVGIAQWRGGKYDRITPMLNFCGGGSASKGNLPPLEKQLDYIWHELHTSEKTAYNKLITSTNIQDAVAGIIYYERDDSYQQTTKGGPWIVNRDSPFYQRKLTKARAVLSSLSYTGNAS